LGVERVANEPNSEVFIFKKPLGGGEH
jgi:hypothetical protein